MYSLSRTKPLTFCLRVIDQHLQRAALGAPPVAVVDQARVARHQVVFQMRDLAIERDGLDAAVGLQQDGAARRLVAAARLHPDIAVLDEVEAADAVLAAELVELREHFRRDSSSVPSMADDVTMLRELDVDVLRRVRRGFGRNRPAPHRLLGLCLRVFQVTSLEADVQEVRVHRVRRAALLVLHVDRNAGVLGVREQLLAADSRSHSRQGAMTLIPGSSA